MQDTKNIDRLGQLFRPVDIASLVFFRIIFGSIMLWEVFRYISYERIDDYWFEPKFNFTYWGFHWVTPWPSSALMHFHLYVLVLLSICIIIGFCYRLAATLFFIGFTYTFLLENTLYLNHLYLVILLIFLIIWMPAHRAFSLDSWLRPSIRSATTPVWSVWLLRLQVGIPYFYGGLAKINPDWLRGVPLNSWLERRADLPFLGPMLVEPWAPYFFSYSGLAIDLLIVPLLICRRTRVGPALRSIRQRQVLSRTRDVG